MISSAIAPGVEASVHVASAISSAGRHVAETGHVASVSASDGRGASDRLGGARASADPAPPGRGRRG